VKGIGTVEWGEGEGEEEYKKKEEGKKEEKKSGGRKLNLKQ
jgi:hypothetical protein